MLPPALLQLHSPDWTSSCRAERQARGLAASRKHAFMFCDGGYAIWAGATAVNAVEVTGQLAAVYTLPLLMAMPLSHVDNPLPSVAARR